MNELDLDDIRCMCGSFLSGRACRTPGHRYQLGWGGDLDNVTRPVDDIMSNIAHLSKKLMVFDGSHDRATASACTPEQSYCSKARETNGI
jgi:hypothetical protein